MSERKRKPPSAEAMAADAKRKRDRYAERVAKRLCTACGQRAREGRRTCAACARNQSKRQMGYLVSVGREKYRGPRKQFTITVSYEDCALLDELGRHLLAGHDLRVFMRNIHARRIAARFMKLPQRVAAHRSRKRGQQRGAA